MKIIILSFFVIIGFMSCKNETSKPVVKPVKEEVIDVGTPLDYPSIPIELITKLYKEADYMDYIFHNLDFSLSQTAKSSIQSSIRFISKDVPSSIEPGCTALGRKFFHINGEIVLEAELYFSTNCAFYIFYVDNKPKYANVLTEAGINFYNNIILQGQKQRDKIISGEAGAVGH